MTASTIRRASSPLRRPMFAAALVIAAVAAVLLAPGRAFAADAEEAVAYSVDESGKKTYYASVEDARTAGCEGPTIYMNKDWEMPGTFEVADSKTLTIDMMGHKMTTNENGRVVLLNEHADLTLKSSVTTTFTYRPFSNEDGKRMDSTVNTITTGGLITEGLSSDDAGGIRMNNDSKLTLENVAVAGNEGDEAGGIYVKKNCTITMNNASVNNNRGQTGGIYVHQDDCNLHMNSSSISRNYGSDRAGGICSFADGTRIVMNGGSAISENRGVMAGGIEIYLNKSFYTVRSDDADRSSSISNNVSRWFGGGGINVNQTDLQQREGTIENITVSGNTAFGSGGGIRVEQGWARIINCAVTENVADGLGGGVYIDGNHCVISGCNVEGNVSLGYGGGVYVDRHYDLTLCGVTTVRGNRVGQDEENDVYLSRDNLFTAYIIGGVEPGSSVGICPFEGETSVKVGKNITTYTYGTYFSNVPDTCINPGSDNTTLWCASGGEGYLAKVNGVGDTRYKRGATITADGTPAEAGKRFWYWDADGSYGLSPVSEYINSDNMYDPVITYTMPNNDTDLKAVCVGYVSSGVLGFAKPEVGKELPSLVQFSRSDGEGVTTVMPASIAWYIVDAAGYKSRVYGVAVAGRNYVAQITVPESKEAGLFFDADVLTASKVHMLHGAIERESAAAVSVDAESGALQVTTVAYAV